MPTVLTQSDWAEVVTEFGLSPGDVTSKTSIVAGFAPDNVGPGNTKAVQLAMADDIPVSYKLVNHLDKVIAQRSLSVWVDITNLGDAESTFFAGFNVQFGAGPPTEGVFFAIAKQNASIALLNVFSFSGGNPEAGSFTSGLDIDTMQPIRIDFRATPSGADLILNIRVFDAALVLRYIKSVTIVGSANVNLTGLSAGILLFGLIAFGPTSPGSLKVDDLKISNDAAVPVPLSEFPILVDFEDASWA